MTAPALSWLAAPELLAMEEAIVPDDARLAVQAAEGDDGAFEELVRRHKRRVFGTAARFARDDHQLEDIAQEVFLRAFKNLARFRGEAPFEHWLARITVSACYDFLRKERRVREQVSLDGAEWDARDDSVEAAIAVGRAREVVGWALRRMAPDEQLILTLCELEERPVREVAQLTGWSESNVKVRAFRARQNLKKILETSHER
jgi:RNA polymerase sigma-70 factor (ECF subfamily)